MRHRSFGISRLHSSLLYSFDRCLYGCPEGASTGYMFMCVVICHCVAQYGPEFGGEKIDCQCKLFVKQDSIERSGEGEKNER